MKTEYDIKWDSKKVYIKGEPASARNFKRASLNIDTDDMRTFLLHHKYIEQYPSPLNPIIGEGDVHALIGKLNLTPLDFFYLIDFFIAKDDEYFVKLEEEKKKFGERLETAFQDVKISMKITQPEVKESGKVPEEAKEIMKNVKKFIDNKGALSDLGNKLISDLERIPDLAESILMYSQFKKDRSIQFTPDQKTEIANAVNFMKNIINIGKQLITSSQFQLDEKQEQFLEHLNGE